MSIRQVVPATDYPFTCSDGKTRTALGRVSVFHDTQYDAASLVSDTPPPSQTSGQLAASPLSSGTVSTTFPDIRALLVQTSFEPEDKEENEETIKLYVGASYRDRGGEIVTVLGETQGVGDTGEVETHYNCSDGIYRVANGKTDPLIRDPGSKDLVEFIPPVPVVGEWYRRLDGAIVRLVGTDPFYYTDFHTRSADGLVNRYASKTPPYESLEDLIGQVHVNTVSALVPCMLLQVGQTYKTRNGKTTLVTGIKTPPTEYPFVCSDGFDRTATGLCYKDVYNHPLDLVEPITPAAAVVREIEREITRPESPQPSDTFQCFVGALYETKSGDKVWVKYINTVSDALYPVVCSDGELRTLTGKVIANPGMLKPGDFVRLCTAEEADADRAAAGINSSMLRLKVGYRYRRRDGVIVDIISTGDDQIHPYETTKSAYTVFGEYCAYGPLSSRDLVEELGSITALTPRVPTMLPESSGSSRWAQLKASAEKFKQTGEKMRVDPQVVLDLIASSR